MSVLLAVTDLWCEIILVNYEHKTERGLGFKVDINPAFTATEWEEGDCINSATVSTAHVLLVSGKKDTTQVSVSQSPCIAISEEQVYFLEINTKQITVCRKIGL